MEKALELFGSLILALVGVIAPVLGFMLSLYRDGVSKLSIQYENEKKNATGNITEQMKKLTQASALNQVQISEIKENLQTLEKIQKTAKKKLNYLNPVMQLRYLFIPSLLSFLLIEIALVEISGHKLNLHYFLIPVSYIYAFLSFCFLTYFILRILKLAGILVEVKNLVDEEKKERDVKTIELLTALVNKTGTELNNEVHIFLNGRRIDDSANIFNLEVEKETVFSVSINNGSKKQMAKDVQAGLIFPADGFILEKGSGSIFTDSERQIIRYTSPGIHANTNLHLGNQLKITVLKSGDHKVKTFIKGENVETVYRDMIIRAKNKGK